MSMRAEAQLLLREIVYPKTGKAAYLAASRRLNWTWNRAKDVYQANHRVRISGEELEQLRQLASRKPYKNPDLWDLQKRLEFIAGHLAKIDPNFCLADFQASGCSHAACGGRKCTCGAEV